MADEIPPEKEIQVPPENVRVIGSAPLGRPATFPQNLPASVNAAAVYSNLTNFVGTALPNGGAEVQGSNTVTRLLADDLTISGIAPSSINIFYFTVANLNAVTVSARARVRFYQDNAGVPGAIIVGFTFNPISFSPSTVAIFGTNVPAITFPTTKAWVGITFDNNNGATGATEAQLNQLGQSIFTPVDLGSSANSAFLTTAGGDFPVNNPAGSIITDTSALNFGWELRSAALVSSITKVDSEPRAVSSTASWTVTFNTSVTGVTAANFTLPTTGSVTGGITSVTANNFASPDSPQSTVFTVVATLGSDGPGTIGLNFANPTGMSINVPAATGGVYGVMSPTAAGVSLSGRVLRYDGRPVRFARLTLSNILTGGSLETQTDERGNFIFEENVSPGATYSLTVAARGYSFIQPVRVISVANDLEGLLFYANKP